MQIESDHSTMQMQWQTIDDEAWMFKFLTPMAILVNIGIQNEYRNHHTQQKLKSI